MEDFDRIQRYLEGNMNNDEYSAFEDLMNQDESLRVKVELQRHENKVIDDLTFEVFKKDFLADNASSSTLKANEANSILKNKYWMALAIAISASLLILASYYYFKNEEHITEERVEQTTMPPPLVNPVLLDTIKEDTIHINERTNSIKPPKGTKSNRQIPIDKNIPKVKAPFKDYGQIAMNHQLKREPINTRDIENATQDSEWKKIAELYNQKQYKEVIAYVDRFSTAYPLYENALNLKALAQMQLREFQSAAIIYKNMIANGDEFQIEEYQYQYLICLSAQLPNAKKEWVELYNTLDSDFTYWNALQKLVADLKASGFNFE